MPQAARTVDRRTLLAALGLTVAGAAVNLRHHPRVNVGSEALTATQSDLAGLVAGYESAPLADTRQAAWSLASRAGLTSKWAPAADRPDWVAVAARALVLEANATADEGAHSRALEIAGTAAAAARSIDDGPTVAHAFAVRAGVFSSQRDWRKAANTAEHAEHHAPTGPVAVMLADRLAIARAEMGDLDGARESLHHAETLMGQLGDEQHGDVGYSMDAYHPAIHASNAARARVHIGDVAGGRDAIDRLSEYARGAGAVGLATYASLMDARVAMVDEAPDEAREHLAAAILTSKAGGRPAAWLPDAVGRMAEEAARRFGVSLYDLAGVAQAV